MGLDGGGTPGFDAGATGGGAAGGAVWQLASAPIATSAAMKQSLAAKCCFGAVIVCLGLSRQ
jgi:hypothetical protein